MAAETPSNVAVTLVFMYRPMREWGFQTVKGWVNWRQYLGAKEC
jgi:hypothetical protein